MLSIRSLDTGNVRGLQPKLSYFQVPQWSPDGRAFAVQGTDLKGRQGIFRIDAQTGDTSVIVLRKSPDEALGSPQWSTDLTKIYYVRRAGGQAPTMVERELAS